MADVFHEGEATLQATAGSRERLAEVGARVIRQEMPEQHRAFFAGLPFVVLAATGPGGQPHATLLAGPPGLLTATDSRHLQLARLPAPDDPLHTLLPPGARFGLLGIEPHTRRRNRANGRVLAHGTDGLQLAVSQSFGNCPKYIHARRVTHLPRSASPEPIHIGTRLDAHALGLIRRADTCFIASAHPDAARAGSAAQGVDVSHRGGRPGFVRVEGDDRLTLPDFAGNQYFNTLGNLLLHPRAGLLFIDFADGSLVWIAATAEIIHDGPDVDAFPGAQRLVRLHVQTVHHARARLAVQGEDGEPSPFVVPTGAWP